MALAGQIELSPEVLLEDWSEYQTADGATLRARLIVFKFLLDPAQLEQERTNIGIKGQVTSVVFSPAARMGAPESLTAAQIEAAPKTQIEVHSVRPEPWCYYRVHISGSARFVKTRLTVVSAGRVDGHFDSDGHPLYGIQTAVIGGLVTPREAREALDQLCQSV